MSYINLISRLFEKKYNYEDFIDETIKKIWELIYIEIYDDEKFCNKVVEEIDDDVDVDLYILFDQFEGFILNLEIIGIHTADIQLFEKCFEVETDFRVKFVELFVKIIFYGECSIDDIIEFWEKCCQFITVYSDDPEVLEIINLMMLRQQ